MSIQSWLANTLLPVSVGGVVGGLLATFVFISSSPSIPEGSFDYEDPELESIADANIDAFHVKYPSFNDKAINISSCF